MWIMMIAGEKNKESQHFSVLSSRFSFTILSEYFSRMPSRKIEGKNTTR